MHYLSLSQRYSANRLATALLSLLVATANAFPTLAQAPAAAPLVSPKLISSAATKAPTRPKGKPATAAPPATLATAAAGAVGRFIPLPAKLKPHTTPKEQVLTAPFTFHDPKGKKWTAPIGTITDGASIPEMFKPMIGPSDDTRYFNASIVHDAFCARANRKLSVYKSEEAWQIHRMFYDACIAGGTDVVTAELMYAAVMIGGGYWTLKDYVFPDRLYRIFQKSAGDLQPAIYQPEGRTRQILEEKEQPSDTLQLQQFRAIAKLIKEKKPPIDELEVWLLTADKQLDRGTILARPDTLTR